MSSCIWHIHKHKSKFWQWEGINYMLKDMKLYEQTLDIVS